MRSAGSASGRLIRALTARFLLLLTATPVENKLQDLYEMISLVAPGLLGTPAQFRGRHTSTGWPRPCWSPPIRGSDVGQARPYQAASAWTSMGQRAHLMPTDSPVSSGPTSTGIGSIALTTGRLPHRGLPCCWTSFGVRNMTWIPTLTFVPH